MCVCVCVCVCVCMEVIKRRVGVCAYGGEICVTCVFVLVHLFCSMTNLKLFAAVAKTFVIATQLLGVVVVVGSRFSRVIPLVCF